MTKTTQVDILNRYPETERLKNIIRHQEWPNYEHWLGKDIHAQAFNDLAVELIQTCSDYMILFVDVDIEAVIDWLVDQQNNTKA